MMVTSPIVLLYLGDNNPNQFFIWFFCPFVFLQSLNPNSLYSVSQFFYSSASQVCRGDYVLGVYLGGLSNLVSASSLSIDKS